MGLIVSIDGSFQEFSPDVKHDDLWLDEDEEQRRLVQERRLRVELAMMRPDHEEEGQGDFRNRLDEERIAFAQGNGGDTNRSEGRGAGHRLSPALKDRPLLDPNCTVCKGEGALFVEDGNLWKECRCVLQERARRYLTPRYLDVAWDEEFDIESWKGSVLYVGPLDAFRRRVKTALMKFGMQYSHQTVQPHDIVQRLFAFYRSGDSSVFEEMKDVDILIVNFIVDPPYQDFGGTVGHILNRRAEKGRRTWVHSRLDPRTDEWKDLYGSFLADQLYEPGRYHQIGEEGGGFGRDVERCDAEEEREEGSTLEDGVGGGSPQLGGARDNQWRQTGSKLDVGVGRSP